MTLVEVVVLVASAGLVVFGPRDGVRNAASVAMLVILSAGAVFCAVRQRQLDTPAPAEHFAAARRAANPYEALFAARIWAESESAGVVMYARVARAFGLYRTCQEQAARLANDSSESLRAEAAALVVTCADAKASEGN